MKFFIETCVKHSTKSGPSAGRGASVLPTWRVFPKILLQMREQSVQRTGSCSRFDQICPQCGPPRLWEEISIKEQIKNPSRAFVTTLNPLCETHSPSKLTDFWLFFIFLKALPRNQWGWLRTLNPKPLNPLCETRSPSKLTDSWLFLIFL